MKWRFFLLSLATTLITFHASSRVEADPPTDKYTVGAILALSGQVSSMGSYVRRGLELSYEQLPPALQSRVSLVFEDDQFDPRLTVSAYRKLRSSHKLDAVIVMASPPANALVPITERDGTLLLAVGASDPTIAVGRNFSFVHWVIPTVLGTTLSDELIRRDYKRVAFITSIASGTIADTEAVVAAMTKQNRAERIVYNEQFAKDDTDFRSAIAQLKQLTPDAVVLVLFPGSLSNFAKQFRTSGVSGELIGMESFEDESEVKASAGALIGTWYVNAAQPTSEFIAAYKDKFKEHPGWAASNAYDTLRLLSEAVATRGTNNRDISSFLKSVKDFHGASGEYSASGDNRFTLPAALKRVSEAGFEELNLANAESSAAAHPQ